MGRTAGCISGEGIFFVVIPVKANGQQIAGAESCSRLEGKLVVYKMILCCEIIES